MRLKYQTAIAHRGWLSLIMALLVMATAAADVGSRVGVITSYNANGANGTISFTVTNNTINSGQAVPTTGGNITINTNTGNQYSTEIPPLQPGQSYSGSISFGPPGGPYASFDSSSAQAVINGSNGIDYGGLAQSSTSNGCGGQQCRN
jgi:hypothetical protein